MPTAMMTTAGMGSSREGLLTGAGVGFHGLEEAWTAQEEGVTRRCGGAARTHKYQDDAGRGWEKWRKSHQVTGSQWDLLLFLSGCLPKQIYRVCFLCTTFPSLNPQNWPLTALQPATVPLSTPAVLVYLLPTPPYNPSMAPTDSVSTYLSDKSPNQMLPTSPSVPMALQPY